MEKIIKYKDKEYHIEYSDEGDHYFCRILEIDQIYSAKTEQDIEVIGASCVGAWIKHNSIWGIKNLKTKQFMFQAFGYKFRFTIMTPYLSKGWLWRWFRYTGCSGFAIRVCGLDLNVTEKNSTEKLIAAIHAKAAAKMKG